MEAGGNGLDGRSVPEPVVVESAPPHVSATIQSLNTEGNTALGNASDTGFATVR